MTKVAKRCAFATRKPFDDYHVAMADTSRAPSVMRPACAMLAAVALLLGFGVGVGVGAVLFFGITSPARALLVACEPLPVLSPGVFLRWLICALACEGETLPTTAPTPPLFALPDIEPSKCFLDVTAAPVAEPVDAEWPNWFHELPRFVAMVLGVGLEVITACGPGPLRVVVAFPVIVAAASAGDRVSTFGVFFTGGARALGVLGELGVLGVGVVVPSTTTAIRVAYSKSAQ